MGKIGRTGLALCVDGKPVLVKVEADENGCYPKTVQHDGQTRQVWKASHNVSVMTSLKAKALAKYEATEAKKADEQAAIQAALDAAIG